MDKIRDGGLWQTQHLGADVLDARGLEDFIEAVRRTEEWVRETGCLKAG